MKHIVQKLHLFIHNAPEPQEGLSSRPSKLVAVVPLRLPVNPGPVIVLFLCAVHQEMFLLLPGLKGHAAVAHINFNGSHGSLYQQIVLLPAESGTIFQNRIAAARILHGYEQHVVLIPEPVVPVGNIAACHGHCFRTASHKKLNAVQLMDVVVQVSS